ncbi:MAG TPA: hydrogenase maturation protease [Anaerolineales bacterium]
MLDELGQRVQNKKVLILGVGNRLRGDEGVGSFIVKRLKDKVNVPLLDGGTVPEKQLSQIEAFHPDLVLVVASADVPNALPGEMGLFELDQMHQAGVKTRAANLPLLFKIISSKSRPDALLIAIQPDDQNTKGVSESVRNALDGLEAMLVELFG